MGRHAGNVGPMGRHAGFLSPSGRHAGNVSRRGRRAGFTLLELLIVLAVAGLALAALGGALQRDPALGRARAAATELAAAFREARGQALRQNRPVEIALDLANARYRVDGGPDRALKGPLRLSLTTAAEQAVPGGAAGSFRFFPDGSCTGGRVGVGGGTVTVWVGVDWLTGRVSRAETS